MTWIAKNRPAAAQTGGDTARSPSRGRRRILRRLSKAGLVLAAAPLSAPFIVRSSKAERDTLRLLIWSDYLPKAFQVKFEADTGIRINHIGYGSNQELVTKLRATRGRGFDLVSPTADRRGLWENLDLLTPIDMNFAPAHRIQPRMLKIAEKFSWNGRLYMVPFVWGTEGLAWRTDKWTPSHEELSFADLWLPEMRGLTMGRPQSMMAGAGRLLAARGELPPFEEAYMDEDKARRIWDGVLKFMLDHVRWPKVLWNDAETQESGFTRNGIVLGQTWDGPPIRLRQRGEPVRYAAPKEGAFAWLDGLAIPNGAKNMGTIRAFIDFVTRPENGALLANLTGYNSVATGVMAYLDEHREKSFKEAYPNGALDNLWPWPPMPAWYPALRDGYRDRFVAAARDA